MQKSFIKRDLRQEKSTEQEEKEVIYYKWNIDGCKKLRQLNGMLGEDNEANEKKENIIRSINNTSVD